MNSQYEIAGVWNLDFWNHYPSPKFGKRLYPAVLRRFPRTNIRKGNMLLVVSNWVVKVLRKAKINTSSSSSSKLILSTLYLHLAKQIVIKCHETILSNSCTSLSVEFNLWFLEISKTAKNYGFFFSGNELTLVLDLLNYSPRVKKKI